MRVAIVMPHPAYPATSGDRIRTVALAEALRPLGVQPFVVAYAWNGEHGQPGYSHVAGRPSGRIARLAWRAQLQIARSTDPLAIYRMPGMQKRMRAQLDRIAPDVIDFQHSYSWFASARASVVTLHNVETDRLGRFGNLNARQSATVAGAERTAIESADATIVLSQADAQRVRDLATPRALEVVPLGYDPGPMLAPPRERLTTLAYVASFDYEPNVEAARLLLARWPGIRAATGAERLVLIGRAASGHLASSDDSVVIRSDVPDVRAALEDADALVVPLVSGGGVRVKIIEAFALGLPVVSTALGIEGLDAVAGTHSVVVPDVDGLVEGIRELEPVGTRRSMVTAARALWEAVYSPRRMAAGALDVYRQIAGRP